MKRKNHIAKGWPLMAGLAVLSMFSLSSCLKSGPYNYNFSGVGASVDLPLAAANGNGVVPFTFGAGANTFPVYADLASPSTLSKATTVTLMVDSAYLNSYNSNNGTAYTLLPDSDYTINTLNLTIPAGQRLDSAQVTFNIAKVDTSSAISYVLPISISSASEPVEQWSHLLIGVTVVQ
ncbi:MAG TPA: DUF1735 domain-containing protein [Puia sp.]|nr:DUF1735 domain-containing protein [Puia sp.]